jgi:hypothetical protein
MRVVYLHGLESKSKGIKNEFLYKNFSAVYDPIIDYKEPNIYNKLLKEIKNFKPDLIIGSSMGGYFSYVIAEKLGIKSLLFNPALHSRSIDIELPFISTRKGFHFLVLGKKDKIINPKKSLEIVKKNNSKFKSAIINIEHRTPYEVFEFFIKKVQNG